MAKYGEIALKGLNKNTFEDMLVRNIKLRIKNCGEFRITRDQSTIYIRPENEEADIGKAAEWVSKTFGVASVQR
ncbi:MAG: tRNA 4-thiouridine(8) synthase ThiI, partial [Ruminiclostridium sp.]|nr:tRNA 4-thiouridine(8) synthase ThiI [Ruminiclostridium sp.]